MSNNGPFIGVSKLQDWIASGGTGRAGMPATSTDEILGKLATFQVTAVSLSQLLTDIEKVWHGVGGDNSLKASLGRLLALMSDAVLETKTATNHAMEVKIAANKLCGNIDRRIAKHNATIEKKVIEIRNSETRIRAAEQRVKEAQKKLNVGDMILHGFETVFTFGQIDRNRDNLEKLKNSLAVIQGELAARQANKALLVTFRNELTALRNGIERVLNVDQTMSSFQNDLLAAAPMILGAYENIDKSENTTSLKVAQIRLKQARPKMDDLLTWVGAFRFKT